MSISRANYQQWRSPTLTRCDNLLALYLCVAYLRFMCVNVQLVTVYLFCMKLKMRNFWCWTTKAPVLCPVTTTTSSWRLWVRSPPQVSNCTGLCWLNSDKYFHYQNHKKNSKMWRSAVVEFLILFYQAFVRLLSCVYRQHLWPSRKIISYFGWEHLSDLEVICLWYVWA